jgi:hypothetical protein
LGHQCVVVRDAFLAYALQGQNATCDAAAHEVD